MVLCVHVSCDAAKDGTCVQYLLVVFPLHHRVKAVLTPCSPAGSQTVRTCTPAFPAETAPASALLPLLLQWWGSSGGTSTPSAARKRTDTELLLGAVTERHNNHKVDICGSDSGTDEFSGLLRCYSPSSGK